MNRLKKQKFDIFTTVQSLYAKLNKQSPESGIDLLTVCREVNKHISLNVKPILQFKIPVRLWPGSIIAKIVHLWVSIRAATHHCQNDTLTCDLNLAGRPHRTYGRAPLPSTPIINQCSRF